MLSRSSRMYDVRKTTIAQVVGSLFAGGLALSAALPAAAANCTLTTNGDWGVAANWNCGVRPGTPNTADTATINIGGIVSVSQPEQIITLTNAGTINMNAFLLTLLGGGSTTNTGTINVGGPVTAALQVAAGHNINNAGGVINVANGSVINQFGSSITGGTINTTGTGALVAFNSASNFLSGVTLNGTLDLATGTGIERINGGLTLGGAAGAININAGSLLTFEGTQTIGGTGTINFGNTAAGNRIQLEGAGTTTIGANITIQGQNGTIGGGQTFIGGANTLVNNGTITANVAGGTINLFGSGGGGITNNNVLQARNGGTLNIQSVAVTQGASGQIQAQNGSTVIQNGASISGGTITTGVTGVFTATNNGNNFLTGVTLAGKLDLATATGIERVNGGLTMNGGTININNGSLLALNANQTIGGTAGTIVFGTTGASNRISLEGTGAGPVTIGSNIVIRGENGTVGGGQSFVGGLVNLVNNGRISADVAGGTINLASAGGGVTTNNGILEAQNGGTLLLSSNIIGNPGGQIVAGAGSAVVQNGVTISGTINTSGSGVFGANGSANNFFDGVTLNGNMNLTSGGNIERVINGLTLNGTISVNNGSGVFAQGTQTISTASAGTIVFGATGNNRLTLEAAGTTTIGANVVIRGENGTVGGGQTFVGGVNNLINNGRISADVAGGTINLASAGGGVTTNNGILEAQNGGTLLLSSNIIGNPGGQIAAGAGSAVVQNGVTISGTINTSGSGAFRANGSANNFFDGVTLNGNLDLTTASSIERVINGLTLNGTISVDNGSGVFAQGTQTISTASAGTIVFGATGDNRLTLEAAGTTTIDANVVIRGENGRVGGIQTFVGGVNNLINNGRISADVAGGTISVQSAGGGVTTNNGTIEALNGGTLVLSSNVVGGATSQLKAVGAGSTVLQNGVTLSGTFNLTTSGGGALRANVSSNNFLNAATFNGGTIDLTTAGSVERVSGGLTLNGTTISVNNGSGVFAQGTQTLGGSGGTITFGATGNNRLSLEGGGTTTIGAGTIINGQNGTIGGGQTFIGGTHNLVNQGTIAASVAGGTINIQSAGGGTFTNNGLVHASAGTLNVQQAVSGTGTLQTSGSGQLNLANAANSTGQLIANGAGAGSTNIGTGNLTVSIDYNNANFGTGNSFDRRANIAGTGQILAAGNVAQGISGTGVTNGGTATPTIAIGNVRVNAPTTQSFQVTNTGTTGPSLRGAIQTAGGGAGLADARLSVTPQNFGPVATGGSSAPIDITFNAPSAGLITLAGSNKIGVVNNFDNVAGQLITITTAPGAAAYNVAQGSVSPSPTVTVANQRILGNTQAALTVTNTAPAGAFTEKLNANFTANTGAATNNLGSVSLLSAGTSNNTNMSVGVNTATEGAKTGTMTIGFQSDGTGTSGLSAISVGSQTVTVNGNVYKVAQGQLNTAPLNFGTVQVGQVVSQNLSISNIATGAAGFVEDLKATFGASSGTGAALISGTGQLTGIQAGQTSNAGNGTMAVNVNTAAAGVVNGAIAVNFITAGAVGGVSNGLGELGVGQASYGVQGNINAIVNVINQASPQINTPTINLGNVRQGAVSPTANVSVTNVATVAPQAALNASISGNAPITATGSFNLLAPGATNNTSLSVGMNTATAGAINGTATIAFVSDANNVGNCAPNCQLNLPSQNVTVTGAVYALANPVLNTPTVNLAARVGNASPSQVVSVTNQSADAFREGLNASISTSATGFTATGSVTNLAAQANSGSALNVALNTATAGTFNGTAVLTLASNGTLTNNSDLNLASQNVTLNGKVYTAAQATVQPTVNFGIVHVGDSVANRGVSVQNSAPVTALNDTLRAQIGGTAGPFSNNGGSVAGLTAGGAANNAALTVGLNTATAGVFNGSASVALTSQNPDMADLGLGNETVTLTAQVNKFANAVFGKVGAGTLTQNGGQFILDFGTVFQNSGALSAVVDVDNLVNGGPADLLDGLLTVTDGNDFTSLINAAFQDVAADASSGDLLSFLFNTNNLGSFQDEIGLTWAGHNASGYRDQDNLYTLLVRGNVIQNNGQVPEPSSLLLMAIAIAGLGAARRKRG